MLIKVVNRFENQRFSSKTLGFCRTEYLVREWTVANGHLLRHGYGLCIYEFPDDMHLYKYLFDCVLIRPQNEVWAVEVDKLESLVLPEKRLTIPVTCLEHFELAINHPNSTDTVWPEFTKMYRKVKLTELLVG